MSRSLDPPHGFETEPPSPTQSSSVEFESERSGYRFELPTQGWARLGKREEIEHGADLALVNEDIGMIKIMISPWNLDFDDLFEGVEEGYRDEVSDFRLLKKERVEIAGLPTCRIEYQGVEEESGERLRFLSHCFLKDGMMFQIIAFTSAVLLPRMKKELAVLVQSFGFVSGTSAPKPSVEIPGGPPGSPEYERFEAMEILVTGVRWGAVGAAVGLALGIIVAILKQPSFQTVLGLLLALPISVGFLVACYRWGAIAGTIGNGLRVTAKIVAGIAAVFLFPIRLTGWIVGGMIAAATRVSFAGEMFARFHDWLIVIITRAGLFVLGLLICTAAGLPYAVYVALSKRIRVNAWGFVGLLMAGAVVPFLVSAGLNATLDFESGSASKAPTTQRPDSRSNGVDQTRRQDPLVTPRNPDTSPGKQRQTVKHHPTSPGSSLTAYPLDRVTARSRTQLASSAGNTYGPGNTIDGRIETAWAEGAPGPGTGQVLKYSFVQTIALREVRLVAGYAKNARIRTANHRLRRIKLGFDGGGSVEQTLQDTGQWQSIDLGKAYRTKNLTLTVLDVYRGTKYDDLAFSEVAFSYEPEYLMLATATRPISEADLRGKSARELRLIRNEIYARHHRPFKTDFIREYFEAQPWYTADPTYSDGRVSQIERQNATRIKQFEEEMGFLSQQ